MSARTSFVMSIADQNLAKRHSGAHKFPPNYQTGRNDEEPTNNEMLKGDGGLGEVEGGSSAYVASGGMSIGTSFDHLPLGKSSSNNNEGRLRSSSSSLPPLTSTSTSTSTNQTNRPIPLSHSDEWHEDYVFDEHMEMAKCKFQCDILICNQLSNT